MVFLRICEAACSVYLLLRIVSSVDIASFRVCRVYFVCSQVATIRRSFWKLTCFEATRHRESSLSVIRHHPSTSQAPPAACSENWGFDYRWACGWTIFTHLQCLRAQAQCLQMAYPRTAFRSWSSSPRRIAWRASSRLWARC